MIDLINDNFSEILVGVFTLLGAFIGITIQTIYNLIKDRNERKDRYLFSMIDRRFQVYSEVYHWCEKLKHLYTSSVSERSEQTILSREWYSKNCLYLDPETRHSFLNFISEVDLYKTKLDDYLTTVRSESLSTEQVQVKKDELKESFEEIMHGIQSKIEMKIDVYYPK